MDTAPRDDAAITKAYDAAAREYARRLFDELADKPLDRALLASFLEEAQGPMLDVGCGPGHVTAWLAQRGADVTGLDLSPGMVEVARERSPGLSFEVGDLFALGPRELGAIVALYAIVNLPPASLPAAAASLFGALCPGGRLLVSFHVGEERVHVAGFMDQSVALDFYFHPRATVEQALEAAGFVLDVRLERRPYPAEHPTTRAYLVAHRPR